MKSIGQRQGRGREAGSQRDLCRGSSTRSLDPPAAALLLLVPSAATRPGAQRTGTDVEDARQSHPAAPAPRREAQGCDPPRAGRSWLLGPPARSAGRLASSLSAKSGRCAAGAPPGDQSGALAPVAAQTGTAIAHGTVGRNPLSNYGPIAFRNRRMRTRMSGGVGAGG